MGEKIALGFHTCVDYEIIWDSLVFENAIEEFDIRNEELLQINTQPNSERGLWVSCLAYIKAGIGGEIVPQTTEICNRFATRFKYRITLGGTSTRAAIAMDKIGYSSIIQMCCFNEYVRRLLPPTIKYEIGCNTNNEECYPHISLTYNKGIYIRKNNINFRTRRENRVLISRDIDSMNMLIKEDFYKQMNDTEVFLIACFSQIIKLDILVDRVNTVKKILNHLSKKVIIVAEDGCYVQKEFRYYVHNQLGPYIDILSMNEDELQEYLNKKIMILNTDQVLHAVRYVYEHTKIKTIIIHSADWALAYGKINKYLEKALEGAVVMAATRFQYGDEYGKKEYEATKALPVNKEGEIFSKEIMKKASERIICIPCKDLRHILKPTVVGLGDAFIGGLLPGLLKVNNSDT